MDNNHTNIVNKLFNTYKGIKNVNMIYTVIDLLTDNEIIIARSIDKWAEGIGLLTAAKTQFDNKQKHLHIYSTGNQNELINKLVNLCIQLEITLTLEQ